MCSHTTEAEGLHLLGKRRLSVGVKVITINIMGNGVGEPNIPDSSTNFTGRQPSPTKIASVACFSYM